MNKGEFAVRVITRAAILAGTFAVIHAGKESYQFHLVQASSEHSNRQVLFEQAVERGCSVVRDDIICPPTVAGMPLKSMRPFKQAVAKGEN